MVEKTLILVEIVSAWDLRANNNRSSDSHDPYCTVRTRSDRQVVHQTFPARKTLDPIWTVSTKSLFVVGDYGKFDLKDGLDVKIMSRHGVFKERFCHGVAVVPWATIEKAANDNLVPIEGTRMELSLFESARSTTRVVGTLALRFRHASKDDVDFLRGNSNYKDSNLPMKERSQLMDTMPRMLQKSTRIIYKDTGKKQNFFNFLDKKDKETVKEFRVKPYPDPLDLEETTWMTKEGLNKTCLKQSQNWVCCGSGDRGKVYLEVLKCDNLKNIDALQNVIDPDNLTDSFVAIVMEDTMLKTDVVDDCLDPRWMPWTRRAFELNIISPASPIIIGVFDDYDNVGETSFAPLGRVVVDISNFYSNTDYVLTYELREDPNMRENEPTGTITIRLRLDWDEREIIEYSYKPVPKFLINTERKEDFDLIRYLCKGEINEERSTMKTLSARTNEITSYSDVIFLAIDKLIQIMLWRGDFEVSLFGKALALPIHSFVFFFSGMTVANNIQLLPSFVFFGLTYMSVCYMLSLSHHPSPWKRVKPASYIVRTLLFGDQNPSHTFEANQGFEKAKERELLHSLQRGRVSAYFWQFISVGLKYKRQYMTTSADGIVISTEDKTGFHLFEDKIWYLYLPLYYMCLALRSVTDLLSWKQPNYSTQWTLLSAFLGLASLFVNWARVISWSLRLFFCLFGPWMKFLDVYFVSKYYKTDAELMESKTTSEPQLEKIFQTKQLIGAKVLARRAFEDGMKLKDMRAQKFGEYSETIPVLAAFQHDDVPLPESYAEAYVEDESVTKEHETVPGQKLCGCMIHTTWVEGMSAR